MQFFFGAEFRGYHEPVAVNPETHSVEFRRQRNRCGRTKRQSPLGLATDLKTGASRKEKGFFRAALEKGLGRGAGGLPA